MPSPFPGMDPYLEGYLWPDTHHRLASEISRRLTPQLRPRYVARLEISVVEEYPPETEIGIMYPDVEVVKIDPGATRIREIAEAYTLDTDEPISAPLTLPRLGQVEVRLSRVEIRDVGNNQLITCIEILSPVNKREPGLSQYRRKQQRLYEAGVHLLELDLLRRGTRPYAHPQIPDVPYVITLTRALSGQVGVWPLTLQAALPVVPVPLRTPDPDARLDLSQILATIYDEAAYDLSIDYTQSPPPPPLNEADAAWAHSLFEKGGS